MKNLYRPRLTITQYHEEEQYRQIEHELNPKYSKWVNFMDYIWKYGSLNVKGATILDYNCEVGGSAIYFITKGAAKVYLILTDQAYAEQYPRLIEKNYRPEILSKIEVVNHKAALNLDFDILKMDCEGCESDTLTQPLLQKPTEFAVSLHKNVMEKEDLKDKIRLLESEGGEYYGNINDWEYVWVKRGGDIPLSRGKSQSGLVP